MSAACETTRESRKMMMTDKSSKPGRTLAFPQIGKTLAEALLKREAK